MTKVCIRHQLPVIQGTCEVCESLDISRDESWAALQELQDDIEDTEEFKAAMRESAG